MHITTESLNETPYGPIRTPISLVEVGELEQGRVLFEGGWTQDPAIMRQMQVNLAKEFGYSSVGLSVFDTIDPTEDFEGGRMKRRADILNYLGEYCLNRMFTEPTVVLTHCAGANILLLANSLPEASDYFPAKRILAEPMIVSGENINYYTRGFVDHRKRARHDNSLISFTELRGDSDQTAIGDRGVRPMTDINFSNGIGLLASAVKSAGDTADYTLVVGKDDPGANDEDIEHALKDVNCEVPIVHYKDQTRFGHGYLLIEPKALETVVPLFRASPKIPVLSVND